MKINYKHIVILICLLICLLFSCKVPGSYPSIIGNDELHVIFNLTIGGHTYKIDYTDSWDSGVTFDTVELSQIEIDYTITLDYGIELRRFVMRIPMPLETGASYTRDDYAFNMILSGRPVYMSMYYDGDTNSWSVSSALDDDDGTSLNLTINGQNYGCVWGSINATLKRLGVDEYMLIEGQFSGRKRWVYD